MKKRGSISSEVLEDVSKILKDKRQLNEWLVFLRDTEPVFYEWVKQHSYRLVNRVFGRMAFLGIHQAQILAREFLGAFVVGFIIKYLIEEKKWNIL